jgi:hypothetical protein
VAIYSRLRPEIWRTTGTRAGLDMVCPGWSGTNAPPGSLTLGWCNCLGEIFDQKAGLTVCKELTLARRAVSPSDTTKITISETRFYSLRCILLSGCINLFLQIFLTIRGILRQSLACEKFNT